ncbi:glycoside hydrolase family 2 protein [Lachnoclostridium sp. Marseille-P6806]|uniref:glycoside hydrolase family 2 protein n=1 Tax=Lachnoclostridium sp. Marseille-P6806 TaxID=2364793 RepID=UPI001030FE3F|nr:glycoside hydrolase family 2 TIM barrel-domain containing protein [Lachnoclostridium sp. Marseille-P6806]
MRLEYTLNEEWYFRYGGYEDGVHTGAEGSEDLQRVDLPHTFNAFDGQDGGADYYRGKALYIKKIRKPDIPDDYEIYLKLGAVNSVAHVYADGSLIAEHRGGYAAFFVNLTESFQGKREIRLAVEADNKNYSDVYPQMADFTFYGGIYREVKLIAVPAAHFAMDSCGSDGIRLSSEIDGDRVLIRCDAHIEKPQKGDMLELCLMGEEDGRAAERHFYTPASPHTTLAGMLEKPHLWQGVEDPYLYDAEVRLVRHNEIMDSISLSYGIREFTVDPEQGFFLNGKKMPLRGVAMHQDELLLGNARSRHHQDMELIRELGANTIRLAHYQHSQETYSLCDEYGFIVWAEIPFISVMNPDPASHCNAMQQMRELIGQNYNHPSIICWGISNEITIGGDREGLQERLKELNALVKELDPSRLSTMAQVSMLPIASKQNRITDLVSYNIYYGWYGGELAQNEEFVDRFHEKYPDRPLGLAEYGCEGIISWHSDEPRCKDYTEEYQALYHEHMAEVISRRDYLWATHIWNMFDFGCDGRDEGGVRGRNNKGLVTFDREIKKDSFYLYKAWWSDESFVHICGKRFSRREKPAIDIKVYSNQKEVTLSVNGKEFAVLKGERVFIFQNVPLTEKYNFIRAAAGEYSDAAVFEKTAAAETAYIAPEEEDSDGGSGAANWFNVIDDTSEAPPLTFHDGYFSIRDTIADILADDAAADTLVAALNRFGAMKARKSMLGIMSGLTVSEMGGMFSQDEEAVSRLLAFTNVKLQELRKKDR